MNNQSSIYLPVLDKGGSIRSEHCREPLNRRRRFSESFLCSRRYTSVGRTLPYEDPLAHFPDRVVRLLLWRRQSPH